MKTLNRLSLVLALGWIPIAVYWFVQHPDGDRPEEPASAASHASTTGQLTPQVVPGPVDPAPAQAPPTATPDATEDVRALRRELDALRQDVSRLQGSLASIAAAVATPVEAATDDPWPPEHETDAHFEAESAARDRREQAIENAMALERPDPGWSRDAREVIHDAINSEELAGARLLDVDCRASICRVEALHESPESVAHFQHLFPARVGELMPRSTMRVHDEGQGVTRSVVYLAREGYRLPQGVP